jgi:hypothetical protein
MLKAKLYIQEQTPSLTDLRDGFEHCLTGQTLWTKNKHEVREATKTKTIANTDATRKHNGDPRLSTNNRA